MQSMFNIVALFLIVLLANRAVARVFNGAASGETGGLARLSSSSNHSASQAEKEDLSEFMKNAYNCMKSKGRNCPPIFQNKEVNLVRSFHGTVNTSPSEASSRAIKNSVEMKFNISLIDREVERVHYSMFRVFRKSLTKDQQKTLREKCNGRQRIDLKLYSYSNRSYHQSRYSLRAVKSLEVERLGEEGWVEFANLTRMFSSFVKDYQGFTSRQVKIRLVVQCQSISPSDVGFVFDSVKQRPQLVEFTENNQQNEKFFSKINGLGGSRLHHSLSKRDVSEDQAQEEPMTSMPSTTSSASIQAELKPLPNDFRSQSCQLYKFTVHFGNITGPNTDIYPSNYQANICAGFCVDHPGKEITNHHAQLQAFIHRHHVDEVPPPCCVPTPGTLEPFSLLFQSGSESTLRVLQNMIATQCSCL